MGFKITHIQGEDAGLELFLNEIKKDAELTEDEMLKKAGQTAKEATEKELAKHKRSLLKRYRISLSDDVKLSIRRNKEGNKVAKISGGKKTGTLWHIVNDGTYRSKALHFIDRAITKLDKDIDGLWGEK